MLDQNGDAAFNAEAPGHLISSAEYATLNRTPREDHIWAMLNTQEQVISYMYIFICIYVDIHMKHKSVKHHSNIHGLIISSLDLSMGDPTPRGQRSMSTEEANRRKNRTPYGEVV